MLLLNWESHLANIYAVDAELYAELHRRSFKYPIF